MAHRSEPGPKQPSPAGLVTLGDEAIEWAVAQALGQASLAQGLALPDAAALLADARRLLAYWNAQLYGACCTDDAAYGDLRADLTDIAHVADALLVDTLTDALTTASHLPRSVTRLIAAFVIKHGFDAGRGLACATWGRFMAVEAAP